MARKHAKIMLDQFMTVHDHFGTTRCAVVKVKGESDFGKKHGIPIGKICQVPGGYEYGYAGFRPIYGPKKTKVAAIKAVVKSYKSWIGG